MEILSVKDKPKIVGSAKKLKPRDVAAFEEATGIQLPDTYRAFMLRFNGGKPKPNSFSYLEKGDIQIGIAEAIIPLCGTRMDVRHYMKVYLGRVPEHLMPVALDPMGNLICLAVSGPESGRLFFWDHELEPEAVGSTEINEYVYPVLAADFAAFVDNLSDASEPPPDPIERLVAIGSRNLLMDRLDKGMDPNSETREGLPCAAAAIMHDRVDLLEVLLDKGAKSAGLLKIAAANGNASAIRLLAKRNVDLEERDSHRGATSLATAVAYQVVPAVEALIEVGADVNARDNDGESVLQAATMTGNNKVLGMLKRAGAK